MDTPPLPEDIALADRLVALYVSRRKKVGSLLSTVTSTFESEMGEGARLHGLIHSTKGRLKDESHLHRKILRKLREGRETQEPYEITEQNLFEKVTDLAAYRMMHLHPRQMEKIHPIIMELLQERKFPLFETPEARVWDLETEKFYKETVGLDTRHTTEKLYSSVHYVVRWNRSSEYTCEIQVRTLSDEVWGEVDHSINYPDRTPSIACKEQIKSLAHLTTSCNRLVDSIFASHKEWEEIERERAASRSPEVLSERTQIAKEEPLEIPGEGGS